MPIMLLLLLPPLPHVLPWSPDGCYAAEAAGCCHCCPTPVWLYLKNVLVHSEAYKVPSILSQLAWPEYSFSFTLSSSPWNSYWSVQLTSSVGLKISKEYGSSDYFIIVQRPLWSCGTVYTTVGCWELLRTWWCGSSSELWSSIFMCSDSCVSRNFNASCDSEKMF